MSDAILDAILKDDPNARVACETTVTTGMASIAKFLQQHMLIFRKLLEKQLKKFGYTRAKYGYDYETMAILTAIDEHHVILHKAWIKH
ncbi:S-adenosylmethionine synthetase N-terminal domain-containing protein [Staphylococcus aureus]